ncbi:MAG: 23S rRNA (pseudouridine(1915)-N(3))-methyltransferase RlmH [Lachnospiraceae bacterium]|nr:23S rRNA (pseudouridine(1915)-N(3))-methyltransferase RlmH [Lachnospiraceae bacterium]
MKIRILCVGKVKEEFYQKQIKEYHAQIQKHCSFEIIEIEDEKTEEHLTEPERERILKIEGQRLLKHLDNHEREFVVALCIDGKQYSTEAWKKKVNTIIKQQEIQQITYIVGGSLGLDAQVVQRADFKLSFSKLTFPHQLMRVMLTEQIYFTLN